MKKFTFIVASFAVVLSASSLLFAFNFSRDKAEYLSQINNQTQIYIAQQQYMLQRLGNNIVQAIKQNDLTSIAQHLNAYEEVIFALAKQGFAIPVTMHLVSLNAAQQIIGSFGLAANSVLAPDDQYYIHVVEEPSSMAVSKLYIKQEMPDYPMLNLGLGIIDQANNYYGHLDLKIAANSLHDYIQAKLGTHSAPFDFSYKTNEDLKPEIVVSYAELYLKLLKYIIAPLITWGSIIALILLGKLVYSKLKSNAQLIIKLDAQLAIKSGHLVAMQQAIALQKSYGQLILNPTPELQQIDVQQLLDDVKAINFVSAIERDVILEFPVCNSQMLRLLGHKVRLMQILSGILYEMILLNKSPVTIKLQLTYRDNHQGKQRLVFSFSDDGFYDQLQDRVVEPAVGDIRCQGWQNICTLVEQESGTLEYIHTAYAGNTISLSIEHRVLNNVVNLEEYYQEA